MWSQIDLSLPEDTVINATIHISSQTPVKNQGQRNTCSAFGVAAALEVLPNMPKDISEKYLYGVQKVREYIDKKPIGKGKFLFNYISSLQEYGILTETEMPYPNVDPKKWVDSDQELVKVIFEGDIGPVSLLAKYKPIARKITLTNYEFMNEEKSKDVARIKYLLDHGIKAIPVSYELYMPAWYQFSSVQYNTIEPDLGYGIKMQDGTFKKISEVKKLFPDIITLINTKKAGLFRTDTRTDITVYGGHVVTIVGYDDQGFIIKNSWGTDWRYAGYERISYDYHRLFAYEALAIRSVKYKN